MFSIAIPDRLKTMAFSCLLNRFMLLWSHTRRTRLLCCVKRTPNKPSSARTFSQRKISPHRICFPSICPNQGILAIRLSATIAEQICLMLTYTYSLYLYKLVSGPSGLQLLVLDDSKQLHSFALQVIIDGSSARFKSFFKICFNTPIFFCSLHRNIQPKEELPSNHYVDYLYHILFFFFFLLFFNLRTVIFH